MVKQKNFWRDRLAGTAIAVIVAAGLWFFVLRPAGRPQDRLLADEDSRAQQDLLQSPEGPQLAIEVVAGTAAGRGKNDPALHYQIRNAGPTVEYHSGYVIFNPAKGRTKQCRWKYAPLTEAQTLPAKAIAELESFSLQALGRAGTYKAQIFVSYSGLGDTSRRKFLSWINLTLQPEGEGYAVRQVNPGRGFAAEGKIQSALEDCQEFQNLMILL